MWKWQTKNKHVKFWDGCFAKINKKLRPVKSPYQIKNEQVNFLLEHIEKKLEEYRKIIEIKDKQLAETQKYYKEQKVAIVP